MEGQSAPLPPSALEERAIENFSNALADLLETLGWDGQASTFSVDARRNDGMSFGHAEVTVRPFDAILMLSSKPPRQVAATSQQFLDQLRAPRRERLEREQKERESRTPSPLAPLPNAAQAIGPNPDYRPPDQEGESVAS